MWKTLGRNSFEMARLQGTQGMGEKQNCHPERRRSRAKRTIFAVEGSAVGMQLMCCMPTAGPSTRELITFVINSLGRDDKADAR
jgi:hypothetical protein